jgi:protocatechuate 3,4-dioxygenase beta subunit
MMRKSILAVFLACAAASAVAEDAAVTRARTLGAEVAHVSARAAAGETPDPAELARLQQALTETSRDVDAASEAGVKLQAVARALSVLRPIAAGAISQSTQHASARDQYILERVTAAHGVTCANALGLSVEKPSRLTLATGSDVWFYASTRTATTLRISTQSDGPDPTLEVVADCSPSAAKLAANDDSFGLDASLTTTVDEHQTVFVHLINRGEGGEVNVVLTASTATITGRVIDTKSGQPVANAYVQALSNGSGYFFSWTNTDGNGNYTLTPGATGPVYVAITTNDYLSQVYPTGYCEYGSGTFVSTQLCDISHAKVFNVTASGTTANVNFSLGKGASLSGQVRGANNDPLPASVQLFGSEVYAGGPNSINADAAGHFTFANLPPGTYYVEVQNSGYLSQMWNHIDCAVQFYIPCDTSKATPIVVGSTAVADIDFTLQQAASIQGSVTSAGGPAPAPYGYVYVLDQSGSSITQAYVDNSGHYNSGGLQPGTYYLYVTANGYFSQLYNMQDCSASCGAQLASGTPLTISANGQQLEADFVLTPYPSLQGHITDATSGTPLANASVVLTTSPNSGGYIASSAVTDASGTYVVASIPPSTFYVWAQSPDHVDEIYDGVICEATGSYYYPSTHCDVSTATPLTSSHAGITQSVVDFALQPSSSVAGHVGERAGPGSDLVPLGIQVTLYDGTATAIALANTDAAGNYSLTDLAPGTYYALAGSIYSSEQYLPQSWQNIDCQNSCAPTTGTPINVPAATAVTGIDFALARVNGIVGRVVDSNGEPIRGVVVDLFNVSDHAYAGGAGTDSLGYFAVTADSGVSYYVATEAGGGYIDQVYSGIACPAGTAYDGKCSLNSATAVSLGGASAQPVIVNFTLQVGDRLFGNGFE